MLFWGVGVGLGKLVLKVSRNCHVLDILRNGTRLYKITVTTDVNGMTDLVSCTEQIQKILFLSLIGLLKKCAQFIG